MKTSLHFEAPADLSVGRVRISDPQKVIADWIATPELHSFLADDLAPGVYSAEISPAGLAPQAVLFEVKEGQANTVSLPTFMALASGGGNTSFYDTTTQRATAQVPMTELLSSAGIIDEFKLSPSETRSFEPLRLATAPRRISVALSQEAPGSRESYGPYQGSHRLELAVNALRIELHRSEQGFKPRERVRLSSSIESDRIERCLVPMYLGGTTIEMTPSHLFTSDITIQIMPVDIRLRAMVRALAAGTVAEAKAVKASVESKDAASIVPPAPSDDPWAAMVYGLLTLRFPEVFPLLEDTWTRDLLLHAGWAFDAHIVRACCILRSATEYHDDQVAAAVAAAKHLEMAQVAGAPYYSYSNELFGEMIGGLSESPGKVEAPFLPEASRDLIIRMLQRWNREFALQRGAGVAFSWLRRDLKALKENGSLVPNRRSTGVLRARDTTVIFQGTLSAGSITLGNAAVAAPEDSQASDEASLPVHGSSFTEKLDYPALHREPGPFDDPNSGRFGGQSEHDGFRLSASFGPPRKRRDWVSVTLEILADQSVGVELGTEAWFFLHPTFSPSRVKVVFRGNRAALSVEAWGGFTVGVWIPSAKVELESDLAQLSYAPRIIQER
ncbi:pYEATS domain-containing protein [Rhizobium sp. ZPR3]|uniref:PYEATS domain-containing protein n=2 Tax=unclassified Rhizobium TaxID=2613769 RepID=A0AAU7SR16_9HYPH